MGPKLYPIVPIPNTKFIKTKNSCTTTLEDSMQYKSTEHYKDNTLKVELRTIFSLEIGFLPSFSKNSET